MHAEIIAIGDELTSGQRLDTNSQWLSLRLSDLGVRVLYHTTVGDDLEANVDVFRKAASRAQLVVCTGGLGPTADDLTRQALADAAEESLVLDEASLAHIEAIFAHRKREMPERNRIQAMFPESSKPIPNPFGTAPGVDIILRAKDNACRLFALPGVPAEMREMWNGSVEPAILGLLGESRKCIRHHVIKCFGVGESDLEQMLPDLIQRGRQPTVGITVSKATITLRISAHAETEEACEALIAPTRQTILDCLGDLVFGEGEIDLHQAVLGMLERKDATLATAEVAASELSGWLGGLGSPRYLGGQTWRDAAVAARASGDFDEGCLARQLARYAAHTLGSTYGIAVVADEGAQTASVGVHGPEGGTSREVTLLGHPDIIAARTAKSALDLLRKRLLQGERLL